MMMSERASGTPSLTVGLLPRYQLLPYYNAS